MKRYRLMLLTAACAALFATSCHGDLDIIQDNQLSASNMWTESSDVTTSAYGIYYLMRSNFVQDKINVFYWGELRVGEYMWGPSRLFNVWVGREVIQNTMTANIRLLTL